MDVQETPSPALPIHPSNRLKQILIAITQVHISQHCSSLLFSHLPFTHLVPLAE